MFTSTFMGDLQYTSYVRIPYHLSVDVLYEVFPERRGGELLALRYKVSHKVGRVVCLACRGRGRVCSVCSTRGFRECHADGVSCASLMVSVTY